MSPAVHWLASYVILSRARSLEGLLLLRLASREQLSTGAPAYLVEAVDRLLALEKISSELMRTHLAQLRAVLPEDILHLFEDTAVDEEAAAFAGATVPTSLPGTLEKNKQPLPPESVVSASASAAPSSSVRARDVPVVDTQACGASSFAVLNQQASGKPAPVEEQETLLKDPMSRCS